MVQQKNKIAIVSPSQNAYSETFIQEQKNGLKGDIYYYYDGSLPTMLENQGSLLSNKKIISYKIQRKFKLTSFNLNELAFIDSLRKNKIEIVLAQYGTTANAILRVCKYLNIPLITHFHGYDASMDSVIKKCNNYKEVFDYSTYVISVSNVMNTKLLDLGCDPQKLIKNTYGPSSVFLDICPKFSEDYFIGLGRFVNKKAPYHLILAFKKVHDKFPNAKMIIGGTGELFETCVNLVRSMKLEDAVLLPGIINREQFVAYLSKGLAFVQHSVTAMSGDQEGTPVAILEASAAGLPIISTKHAGISDVVIEGQTGFLVPEHDVEGMAEKMIWIFENQDKAKELGIKAKEQIKLNFTLKRHLEVLDSLIEKAIKKNT